MRNHTLTSFALTNALDAGDPRALDTAALVDYMREQHDLHLRAAIPFVPSLAARVATEYRARDPRLDEVRDTMVALRRLLERHLDEEEDELFAAIRDGQMPDPGEIRAIHDEHRHIGAAIDRLRTLTDGYHAPAWACTCYRTLLERLQALETHVMTDVHLEDHVLFMSGAKPNGDRAPSGLPAGAGPDGAIARSMINPQETVASLVLDHSECAAVLQRHRIDYCCRGDATLATACRDRRLDLDTLIEELERAISERRGDDADPRALSSAGLIEHILSRYHAPLRKTLPFVRTLAAKVGRVHGEHNRRLIELDEIVAELAETLAAHIDDEEATLFLALAQHRPDAGDLANAARDEHAVVGGLLGRMRTAADDYVVPNWACNSYRTLFRELERLETDVLRHVHLENHVLLPRFQGGARCA